MAEHTHGAIERGYEPDQPQLRGIAIGAGAIVLAVLVAVTTGLLIERSLRTDETPATDRAPLTIVGAPRLQPTPERDFPAFRDEKEHLLHAYAWADRPHGVVRIPIDRAMALLVQQHATAAGRQ
jgi:hypothetical protein